MQRLLADMQENEANEQLMATSQEEGPSFMLTSSDTAVLGELPARRVLLPPLDDGIKAVDTLDLLHAHPGTSGFKDYINDDDRGDLATRTYPNIDQDSGAYDRPTKSYKTEPYDHPVCSRNERVVYDKPTRGADGLYDHPPPTQHFHYDYPPWRNNINNNYDFPPKSRHYPKTISSPRANGHAVNGTFFFQPTVIPPLPRRNHANSTGVDETSSSASSSTSSEQRVNNETVFNGDDDYLVPINGFISPKHRVTSV